MYTVFFILGIIVALVAILIDERNWLNKTLMGIIHINKDYTINLYQDRRGKKRFILIRYTDFKNLNRKILEETFPEYDDLIKWENEEISNKELSERLKSYNVGIIDTDE